MNEIINIVDGVSKANPQIVDLHISDTSIASNFPIVTEEVLGVVSTTLQIRTLMRELFYLRLCLRSTCQLIIPPIQQWSSF